MKKYYLDTCIWIDYFENRKGYCQESLGKSVWKLFCRIIENDARLVITDLFLAELKNRYSSDQITNMIRPFERIIDKIFITKNQRDEAKKIAEERDLPPGDVLHAILARDYNLTLVTRDKHFKFLEDISDHFIPEDLI